jgi:hypothetical protein
MYGVYVQRWYAAAFGLAVIIILASLRPGRRRYWLAFAAYGLFAIGTAVAIVFPIFFQISLANAFGPSQASAKVYLVPLLILIVAVVPAFALLPALRSSTARRIAAIFFGLPLLTAAIFTLIVVIRPLSSGGQSAPFAGFLCLLCLLLWMRVDGLRGRPTDQGDKQYG